MVKKPSMGLTENSCFVLKVQSLRFVPETPQTRQVEKQAAYFSGKAGMIVGSIAFARLTYVALMC